jgi:hypothetical protein
MFIPIGLICYTKKGADMAFTEEQMEDIQAALETFKQMMGEKFAPYCGIYEEENFTTLCAWGEINLPNGLLSFIEPAAYEISFAQCLASGALKRDPNWLSRADRHARDETIFQKLFNSIPANTFKAIYLGRSSEYRNVLSDEQQSLLNLIGVEAFKRLVDARYKDAKENS